MKTNKVKKVHVDVPKELLDGIKKLLAIYNRNKGLSYCMLTTKILEEHREALKRELNENINP